jgi:hypothetical protein
LPTCVKCGSQDAYWVIILKVEKQSRRSGDSPYILAKRIYPESLKEVRSNDLVSFRQEVRS